ncbi:MAG: NF038129 family PEP-CTERM protein [Candidatus Competibacteraceae bacterium]|nr:NF038129 family PEP-CTERM protein [Candidatus Competibacteraceae bacterium]
MWRPMWIGQTASTPSSLRRHQLRWLGSLGLLLSLSSSPTIAGATVLRFMLDTSSLSGVTATLAFDFLNYDPASNSVTVTDFFTDGILGAASSVGSVTGTLPPGPVTLADSDFFNEFLQPLTLGNTVSFTLNLTEHAPSGSPLDGFSFYLLNATATLSLFATNDPIGGDALFAVDIDGASDGIRYPFDYAGTGDPVTWTLEPVTVPLPSTALLIGAGLLGGLAARRRDSLHTVGRATARRCPTVQPVGCTHRTPSF